MRRNIQVAVVDAAGFMRDGLCALLCGREELNVVGAIDSNPQQISMAGIPQPDVALLPCSAANLAAVTALKKRWPDVHILMLTSDREGALVDAALHAGIAGYVFRSSSQADLLTAIRSVALGNRYLAAPAFERPVAAQPVADTQALLRGPATLSEREREVMRLIAEGYRTREMAEQLSLSHKTVEKHRSNLMRKLGLRSATAVVAYAIKHGYVATAT
jgi:two-component system response regulator NreC